MSLAVVTWPLAPLGQFRFLSFRMSLVLHSTLVLNMFMFSANSSCMALRSIFIKPISLEERTVP